MIDDFETIERVPARDESNDLWRMFGFYVLFVLFCLIIGAVVIW